MHRIMGDKKQKRGLSLDFFHRSTWISASRYGRWMVALCSYSTMSSQKALSLCITAMLPLRCITWWIGRYKKQSLSAVLISIASFGGIGCVEIPHHINTYHFVWPWFRNVPKKLKKPLPTPFVLPSKKNVRSGRIHPHMHTKFGAEVWA